MENLFEVGLDEELIVELPGKNRRDSRAGNPAPCAELIPRASRPNRKHDPEPRPPASPKRRAD